MSVCVCLKNGIQFNLKSMFKPLEASDSSWRMQLNLLALSYSRSTLFLPYHRHPLVMITDLIVNIGYCPQVTTVHEQLPFILLASNNSLCLFFIITEDKRPERKTQ